MQSGPITARTATFDGLIEPAAYGCVTVVIREGSAAVQIVGLIEEDRDIAILVLAAATGTLPTTGTVDINWIAVQMQSGQAAG